MTAETDSPVPLSYHEKMELKAAAFRATRVLPPNLARLISEELNAWENFGYRFGGTGGLKGCIREINQLSPRQLPAESTGIRPGS